MVIRKATRADREVLGRLGALLMTVHYNFDRRRFLAPGEAAGFWRRERMPPPGTPGFWRRRSTIPTA